MHVCDYQRVGGRSRVDWNLVEVTCKVCEGHVWNSRVRTANKRKPESRKRCRYLPTSRPRISGFHVLFLLSSHRNYDWGFPLEVSYSKSSTTYLWHRRVGNYPVKTSYQLSQGIVTGRLYSVSTSVTFGWGIFGEITERRKETELKGRGCKDEGS